MTPPPPKPGAFIESALPFLRAALVAALVFAAPHSRADVSLAGIFADHMVLQRDMPLPVWGRADAGLTVRVSFAGQTKSGTASPEGKWRVMLDPLTANATPSELVVTSDKGTARVADVLVGEVWLCSGQSNMEWALSKSDGGSNAIAASANPLLRQCRVPHNVQFTPQSDLALKWEVSQPSTVKNWSAVPYWFGAKLQKELGVPVGIINSAFGGTTIQAWMSEATLKQGKWPQDKWSNLELAKADYDKRAEAVRPLREKYEADKAASLAEKRPAPPMPAGLMSEFKGVSTLWNGEVVPLLPFRLRGVAWYQGESNAYVGVADTYHDLLTALIPEWRAAFEQPDLPFLIFQIARNRKWQTDPNENSGNAVLQEAQARVAASTTNTALIVTTDKGGPDVHYTDKEPIAARAVNAALSLAYAKPAPFAGPKLRLANVAPHSIVLEFDHSDGGLVAQDGPLTGFVIAGVDRKFVFADARIEGNTVVVSSPEVSRPVAVRYGWADLPKVNLFNGQGLPAAPFRTDDWPTTTKP